jgi:hypothetical protein
MKEIWIFGDSYVDRNYTGGNNNTWPLELEKKYAVKNFGLHGTGPTWSLHNLMKERQHRDNCSDITLIFFVSEIFRLDLKCLEITDQTLIYNFLTNNNNVKNKLYSQKKNQYKKFLPFINELWDQLISNESFRQTELLKIISSIQLLSQSFNKTIIWPCFDLLPVDVEHINNTTVVNYNLAYELDTDEYEYSLDPRGNHLSKPNHDIMFKMLCDWIDHDLPIDTSKFVKS